MRWHSSGPPRWHRNQTAQGDDHQSLARRPAGKRNFDERSKPSVGPDHLRQVFNDTDMVLAVNGLPVATIELKNPGTGQSWKNTVRQYKEDRDSRAPLFEFKKRALVHFAADPDEVWMTTRLAGEKTYFLPFNRGSHPGKIICGAGNPQHESGYRTGYFWEDVLQFGSFLDILGHFMFLEKKEEKVEDGRGGQPAPSDPNMAQFYGLALPLLKRGMPITPVQLENVTLPNFLEDQRVLLLAYQGQKPLTAQVHSALAAWVRKGGVLVMVDNDKDPYNSVREWWNDDGGTQRIPRQHLFDQLGLGDAQFSSNAPALVNVGKGAVGWVRQSPVPFALSFEAETRLISFIQEAARKAGLKWKETDYLALRRGLTSSEPVSTNR